MAEAECAIDAGDGARAQAALAEPLGSRNVDRRSRAEYAAARAAVLGSLGRLARAVREQELVFIHGEDQVLPWSVENEYFRMVSPVTLPLASTGACSQTA